jgi:hypothetical protein
MDATEREALKRELKEELLAQEEFPPLPYEHQGSFRLIDQVCVSDATVGLRRGLTRSEEEAYRKYVEECNAQLTKRAGLAAIADRRAYLERTTHKLDKDLDELDVLDWREKKLNGIDAPFPKSRCVRPAAPSYVLSEVEDGKAKLRRLGVIS